ncbi:MAG: DUF5597 domain-containing protein [Lachnospiraceae bacterium]
MAYQYASAVETISKEGQKVYPLPCYANVWLKQYPWYPGSYPSGGPVREMHEIWKLAAPSLFTLAPDIYVPYVADVMGEYSYEGNPLLIPEVRKDAVTASYCLYAFGKYNAICYSPFGIEELALDPDRIEKPPMELMVSLNIDPTAFDIEGSKEYLSSVYALLENLKPLYLQYRGSSRLHSYLKKSDTDFGALLKAEKYDISVSYDPKRPIAPLASGMIFELSADIFLVIGMCSTIRFSSKEGCAKKTEILRKQEGTIHNGIWCPGRILNGDEKRMLSFGNMVSCIRIELYQF